MELVAVFVFLVLGMMGLLAYGWVIVAVCLGESMGVEACEDE